MYSKKVQPLLPHSVAYSSIIYTYTTHSCVNFTKQPNIPSNPERHTLVDIFPKTMKIIVIIYVDSYIKNLTQFQEESFQNTYYWLKIAYTSVLMCFHISLEAFKTSLGLKILFLNTSTLKPSDKRL